MASNKVSLLKYSISLTVCLIAAVIQGCSFIPNEFLEKDVAANANLPAVKTWTESGVIRVLLVHGMGDHPFGFDNQTQQPNLLGFHTYAALNESFANSLPDSKIISDATDAAKNSHFQNFIPKLANQLGYGVELKQRSEFHPIYDPEHSDGKRSAVGYWFSRSYGESEQSATKIKFYVVEYAFAGAVKKESQFGSWDGQSIAGHFQDFDPKIDGYRHKLNRQLKLSVVDWGLGDASLYLGKYGEKYKFAVSTIIKKVEDDLQEPDHLAIITESLGSTVTLDALRELQSGRILSSARKSDRLLQLLRNPRSPRFGEGAKVAFYMCANQFGLLHVGGMKITRETVTPLTELDQTLASTTKIPLVSFTDPDDLLSYWVNPRLHHFDVCNVLLRNKNVEYLPGILGLVYPVSAHLNYDQNPIVFNMILNGTEKGL